MDFDNSSGGEVDHDNFTDAFISLVKGKHLTRCTHLDLSGIVDLRRASLNELMGELVDCKLCENLMSIHLNDLGLNFNLQLREDITDLFRIQSK